VRLQVLSHGEAIALGQEDVDDGRVPAFGIVLKPVDGAARSGGGPDHVAFGKFLQSVGQCGGDQGVVFYQVDAGHRAGPELLVT